MTFRPSKQDRIEVKIINRLNLLDRDFIFLNVFHDDLLKCNTFRTPRFNSDGNEVYQVITQTTHIAKKITNIKHASSFFIYFFLF